MAKTIETDPRIAGAAKAVLNESIAARVAMPAPRGATKRYDRAREIARTGWAALPGPEFTRMVVAAWRRRDLDALCREAPKPGPAATAADDDEE